MKKASTKASEKKLTKSEAKKASTEQNPGVMHVNEKGIASTDQAQLVDNAGGYQGDPISGRENTPAAQAQPSQDASVSDSSSSVEKKDDWSKADEGGSLSSTIGDLTRPAFTIVENGDTYTVIKVMVNPIGGEKCRMEVLRERLSKEEAEELFKATAAKELF
jgi:hypothetical protein